MFKVWAALLENMPMTAMIRNLGKMSTIGLLKPLSANAATVCKRLKDETLLKRARIHPFNVLLALKTYESGRGDKGKLQWEVNQTIVQALDSAFYASFKVRGCSLFMYELGSLVPGVSLFPLETRLTVLCPSLH